MVTALVATRPQLLPLEEILWQDHGTDTAFAPVNVKMLASVPVLDKVIAIIAALTKTHAWIAMKLIYRPCAGPFCKTRGQLHNMCYLSADVIV